MLNSTGKLLQQHHSVPSVGEEWGGVGCSPTLEGAPPHRVVGSGGSHYWLVARQIALYLE